ncbi:MAG TPA: hypothetical protein VMH38_06930 [Thermoplasmata archaeon]|nr:hypothetical protein [Thermoplasmata archaeon]
MTDPSDHKMLEVFLSVAVLAQHNTLLQFALDGPDRGSVGGQSCQPGNLHTTRPVMEVEATNVRLSTTRALFGTLPRLEEESSVSLPFPCRANVASL